GRATAGSRRRSARQPEPRRRRARHRAQHALSPPAPARAGDLMARAAKPKKRVNHAQRRQVTRLADTRHRLLAPRLVLLFCAGCLLFGTPALWPTGSISATRIGGVPVLYVALFAA